VLEAIAELPVPGGVVVEAIVGGNEQVRRPDAGHTPQVRAHGADGK